MNCFCAFDPIAVAGGRDFRVKCHWEKLETSWDRAGKLGMTSGVPEESETPGNKAPVNLSTTHQWLFTVNISTKKPFTQLSTNLNLTPTANSIINCTVCL